MLLCGGESERLGFPKEMLRVDGEPLVVKQVRRLQALFCAVFVSSNRPERLRHLLDVPILEDEIADAGPLAGVLTGLRRAGTGRVFFLACDLPAVPDEVIETLVARAAESEAQTVLAHSGGQFLCAVHDAGLAPALERFLLEAGTRSVQRFLEGQDVERVEFPEVEHWRFRDVDAPDDLWLLRKVFSDVEPLPVRKVAMRPVGGRRAHSDVVVEEWPVALHVNGVQVAALWSLPTALKELAVGFASYLGLVDRPGRIRALEVDYEARRVDLELDVEKGRIRSARQPLVTVPGAAGACVPQLLEARSLEDESAFRVSASHVLESLEALGLMAPVFERTGGTHQAAFSDGEGIRCFFEDVGRHNALDKVIGRTIMEGRQTAAGLLLTTGRIGSEMVVRALRRRVPVLAGRSAVTSGALRTAQEHGLTLVGFARDGRLNVYTAPGRVLGSGAEKGA